MTSFELSRSIVVDAPQETIHAKIEDFREWASWSPWEGLDPDLKRTYTGPDRGVGATYAWEGNSKAGSGQMSISQSDLSRVVVDLRFVKPFKATNVTTFTLTPRGDSTEVTWTMTGQRNAVMAMLGKLFFDKTIGRDFEKGLTRLKAVAENA